ncbi:hypothetical protein ACQP2T_62120 [Nonomuraea sp. CA-143628]
MAASRRPHVPAWRELLRTPAMAVVVLEALVPILIASFDDFVDLFARNA